MTKSGILLLLMGLSLSAWTQEKYPLSRQDSARINKYDSLSSVYESQEHFKEQSRFLNKTAMIYWEHNHFQKSVDYYLRSLKVNKRLGNENGIAMINSNMAMIYSDLGAYKKSLNYFRKTLTARKVRKEKVGTISALINMSVVLNNLKRYDKAVEQIRRSDTLFISPETRLQLQATDGESGIRN